MDLKKKDSSLFFIKNQRDFFLYCDQDLLKRPLGCCTFIVDQSGSNVNANTVMHAFFKITEYDTNLRVSKIQLFVVRKDKYNWGGLFHKPHSHTPYHFLPPLSVEASVLIKSEKKKIDFIKIDPYNLIFIPKKFIRFQKDI